MVRSSNGGYGTETSGDDTLTGDGANDNILGQAGNDTISGGGGDDVIYGDILLTINAGLDAAQPDNSWGRRFLDG